jgi:AcrR family transcriptional regulator
MVIAARKRRGLAESGIMLLCGRRSGMMETLSMAAGCGGVNAPQPFNLLNVIWDSKAQCASRTQPQWAQLRSRKATILASARKLLASNGLDRLTIKQIANEVNMSVPTIYNLVGTRHDVLVQAMNDHTIAMGRTASNTDVYPHFVVGLADLYGELAISHPEFMNAITATYFSGNKELFHPWHNCGLRMIVASVKESLKRDCLRPGINPESIGRRCSATISTGLYEWSIGSIANADLRFELISSVCDSMMRAFTPAASADLEIWLDGYFV